MRFLATMLFSAALALPALAQPGRGGPGGRPGEGPNPQAEIEKLKQLVRELEGQLQKGKDEPKKPEPKKEDVRKPEPKKDEPKKEEFKKPEPRKEGGEFVPPGLRGRDGEGGFGGRGGEGPGGFRPMGGPMGGMMMGGPGMNFPGLNNLTPEEQATFRKLVAKMNAPKPEPKPEGKKPEGKPGSNVEERLERLEKMVQELVRSQRGR
jgi:hypothetical protein